MRALVIAGIGLLALAGCGEKQPSADAGKVGLTSAATNVPAAATSAKSFQMMPCGDSVANAQDMVPENLIVSVVKIVLAEKLDFRDKIDRNVTKDDSWTADPNTDDPTQDDVGSPNDYTLLSSAKEEEPFHIHLRDKPKGPSKEKKYVLVKIIKKYDRKFSFYGAEAGDSFTGGVGRGEEDNYSLCGIRNVKNGGREVAIFYIDLSKLGNTQDTTGFKGLASFNIGLRLKRYPGTPIFIDPKVRNDG